MVRPLLPASAARQGARRPRRRARTAGRRASIRARCLLLMGCVQPAMLPNINSATARVLDAAGIQTLVASEAGCCGAIRLHLNDHDGALERTCASNIDVWWPLVSAGSVEAIVMNASGCGVTVKQYGHSLRARSGLCSEKARQCRRPDARSSPSCCPIIVATVLPRIDWPRSAAPRLAFHPPCTLQAWATAARWRRDALASARLRHSHADERGASLHAARPCTLQHGPAARAGDARARPQALPSRRARASRSSSRPTSTASSNCRAAPIHPSDCWFEVPDDAISA